MKQEKIVLFDGASLDGWHTREGGRADWTLEDGVMTVKHGDIITDLEFADAHLHVEFREPYMPDRRGQGRGNSGVYIHGCYEVQVLDSFGKEEAGISDCGALYEMIVPLTNANLPPLEWQTYDLIIRAPRFTDGKMTECGRLTLLFNGKVVHNNVTLPRATPGGIYGEPVAKGPLLLQDHGDPVSFRNIWIVPLS